MFLRSANSIWVIITLVALSSVSSWANTEQMINSIHSPGTPFLVVTEDNEGGSNREPGIYTRSSEQGKWKPILLGEVDVDMVKGPIFEQLAMSKITSRYESLFIVDSRLVLVSSKSNPENKSSYLTFGEGTAELFDPVANQEIGLPEIQNASEVSYFAGDLQETSSGEGQLLLFSIKYDQLLQGDGVTFAVVVKASESNEAEITTLTQPILVDYSFHGTKELRELVIENRKEPVVFSKNLMNSLKKGRQNDPSPISEWRGKLAQSVDGDGDLNVAKVLGSELPYYSLISGESVFPTQFSSSLFTSENNDVVQEYDFEGRGKFSINTTRTGASVYESQGEVAKFADGRAALGPVDQNDSAGIGGSFLFFANSTLNIFWAASNRVQEIDQIEKKISNASWHFIYESSDRYSILVSYLFEDGTADTRLYRIKTENNRSQVLDDFRIGTTFYSQESLSRRVHQRETGHLFDVKTEDPDNFADYDRIHDLTAAHLNLNRTTSSDMVWDFPEFLSEMVIAPKSLTYFEFNEESNGRTSSRSERHSGIYEVGTSEEGARRKQVVSGYIVPNFDDKTNPVLDEQDIVVGERNVKVRIVALEREKGGSEKSPIELYAIVSVAPFDEIKPVVRRIYPKYSLTRESVQYVTSVANVRNGDISLSVLLGSKEEGASSLMAERLDVEVKNGQAELGAESSMVLSNDFVGRGDIFSRLLYDQKGKLYWVIDPTVDQDDPKYTLYNLEKNDSIKPNLADKKMTFATFESNLKGDKSDNSYVEFMQRSQAYEWKVDDYKPEKSQLVEKHTKTGDVELSSHLFPELSDLLDSLASDPHPKNQVIVVPAKIKKYIMQTALNGYINSKELIGWSRRNKRLQLFAFRNVPDRISTQEDLRKRLSGVARETLSGQRAVLFADATDVTEIGKISPSPVHDDSSDAFYLTTSLVDPGREQDVGEEVEAAEDQVTPHALYWLGTEGRKVEAEELSGRPKINYSKIIIATDVEWEALKSADGAGFEMSFGLDDHFDVLELSNPDIEAQKEWFKNIFDEPAIQKLDLSFDARNIHRRSKDLSEEEARDQVIGYLVNRIGNLSESQGRNPLLSFNKILKNFRELILTDHEVRKNRKVDVVLIDKILSRVFQLSLKLENLSEDDYLRQVSKDNFMLRVQNEGEYMGAFKYVKEMRSLLLEQLRNETIRPVPASFTIYGESGTGKTGLIRALIKTLGLKPYRMKGTSSENAGAQYFFIDGSELTGDSGGALNDVDHVINHIKYFLTLPNGHRGMIFIDDIHVIPDTPRQKLIQFLRTIVDASDGQIELDFELDGKAYKDTVPTRNLVVGMSLNFTDKEHVIEKYKKNKNAEATVEEKMIATLNGEEGNTEKSFLRRISLHLEINEFPEDAKGPALINNLAKQGRELFNSGQFFVTSPNLVDQISDKFRKLDARNFLSGAANSIINQATTAARTDSGLRIVVPLSDEPRKPIEGEDTVLKEDSAHTEKSIRDYIADHSVTMAIDESTDAQLYFLDLVVTSFRTHMIGAFLNGINQHALIAGDESRQESYLKWAERAVLDHITQNPNLPLVALQIDPYQFGIKDSLETKVFKGKLEEISGTERYFPDIFSSTQGEEKYRSLIDSNYTPLNDNNRAKINSQYADLMSEQASNYLRERIRVENLFDLPASPEGTDWFAAIKAGGDPKVRMEVGKELADHYINYIRDINDRMLIEMQASEDVVDMAYYDYVRMYLYTLDKAIAKLPWARVLKFLVKNLGTATDSMVYGSDSALQEYLFQDRYSIVRPTTSEIITQLLENSESQAKIDRVKAAEKKKNFESNCTKMLKTGRGSK